MNLASTALRFFFAVTLERSEITQRMPFRSRASQAAGGADPDEVARVLEAAPGLKWPDGAERGLRRAVCGPTKVSA